MIPATPAIKIPTITCGKNNPKTNIPTNAPIGSVIPDNAKDKALHNVFYRLHDK